MFASPRVRAVIGIGAALAVVAAVGIGVATSTSASASDRFVTTTSSTGDVTQTYTATGSITRKNTETASFDASGTVNSVKVAVGDKVEAGQVLATIDSRALKLALLQAETTVAQAELNLYNARHPSSSSSSSSKKAASSSSSSSKTSGSKTPTDTSLTTVTFNLTQLNEAVSGVNLAVADEAKQCDAIMAWVNDETSSSTTTTTTSNDSSSEKAASAATPSASESSASTEPSASSSPSTEVSAAEASASESASPSASATQYAATSDPTEDQIKACATARATLITANTTLQSMMETINTAAGAADDNSSANTGSSGSSGSGSSSSSSTVSKSQVASAKATLLEAEQKLQTAKNNLANAELLAPISGTVGTVSITKGDSSSSGSVTIVGSGSAVVTFELPLTTRKLVSVGAAVTVTPAGSSTTLSGKVTWISALETSGTSGSTATYSTTVAVSDPDQVLLSGAKASVLIPVKSVTGVVRVPASAVTPTGTGTATVQTVTAANATSATSVTVETGAVGGGWVEITSGLTAGQLVVLADSTEAIPTTTTSRRTTTSSSSTTKASSSATALPSAGTSSSQPSAQATK